MKFNLNSEKILFMGRGRTIVVRHGNGQVLDERSMGDGNDLRMDTFAAQWPQYFPKRILALRLLTFGVIVTNPLTVALR